MKTLSEYLADWDPMGFITHDGAPMDEYRADAGEIKLKFKSDMSEDEVAQLVYDVLTDRVGLNPQGFRDECFRRSAELKECLIKN